MVGRDAEFRALVAAAARARQGEVGLVLVTGEAGIGKSRLVSEFVGGLDDALTLVSHGVAMSTGEIPFGVLADLLKNLVGTDPTVLTGDERDALAPLLPGPKRSGDRITMLSTALDLLERLSSDRLVLWVVEDLHWADAASRDLLGVALHTRPGHRLLVVATVRTDDPARSSAQELAVTGEIARLAQLRSPRRCTWVDSASPTCDASSPGWKSPSTPSPGRASRSFPAAFLSSSRS